MRILQINANYGFSSTGLIMTDIGTAITEAGHEAYFAYQNTAVPVETGYRVGSPLDWKWHALACRVGGGQGFHSGHATRRLLRHIDMIRPDVVHLHNLHSNFVHLGLLLDYLAAQDIATVITMHDCWYFTGKCFHYIDVGCEGFKTGCGHCVKQSAPPASLFVDRSAKDLATKVKALHRIPRLALVGCSDWICREAEKSRLSDCTITRIYNGVDTTVFAPRAVDDLRAKLGIGTETVVLGMANKWMQADNRPLIEQVLALPDTHLVLVGCTDAHREALSAFGSRVSAVGFISDRTELAGYYNLGDVFVNPTHADTLPTVNMESICCGTPVVTYDACGSPELVDAESGVVVPEHDRAAMVAAIQEARRLDRTTCAAVGQRRFDKQLCYRAYPELYRALQTARHPS